MGLAQAEQKEVRAREEGGSRGSSAGGWRAAGRQAGGLAGWLGEGCAGLGWPGSLGQDYIGLLAGVEAAWQPPSLPLSPWASLSLHLTVFCNAPSAIPAVWSSPAASAHPSCSELPTIRLSEAPAPPASPFPCLSPGPCFCPVSSSLLSPPPPLRPMSASICLSARGACQATDKDDFESGRAHSAACPPGTSAAGTGCCSAAPLPHLRDWGHNCLLRHLSSNPDCRKPAKATSLEPAGCASSPPVPSACSAVGIRASRSSGVTVS